MSNASKSERRIHFTSYLVRIFGLFKMTKHDDKKWYGQLKMDALRAHLYMIINNGNSFKRIITDDESRVYGYDPKPKWKAN